MNTNLNKKYMRRIIEEGIAIIALIILVVLLKCNIIIRNQFILMGVILFVIVYIRYLFLIKKTTKNIFILLITFLIAITSIVLIGFIGNKSNKLKPKNLTKNEKNMKEVGEEYLITDGKQVIKIEDYTVTLEKYCFDSDIYYMRVLFSIMQDGKEGKDIYCNVDEDYNSSYSENEEYGLDCWFGNKNFEEAYYFDRISHQSTETLTYASTRNCKSYYDGKKKYVYLEVSLTGLKESEFDGVLTIKDNKIESSDTNYESEGVGTYKMKDSVAWEEFTSDTTNDIVKVSNYAAQINDGAKVEVDEFNIVMKNGKKRKLQEEKKYITEPDKIREEKYDLPLGIIRLHFGKGLDIGQVDYVELNGIKYCR